jgi:hypothetical protein
MVTNVKDDKVFIDYKHEVVHAAPLKSSGWSCSSTDVPRGQHRWCMLKSNASTAGNKAQESKPMISFEWEYSHCTYSNEDDVSRNVFGDTDEGG